MTIPNRSYNYSTPWYQLDDDAEALSFGIQALARMTRGRETYGKVNFSGEPSLHSLNESLDNLWYARLSFRKANHLCILLAHAEEYVPDGQLKDDVREAVTNHTLAVIEHVSGVER